MRKVKPQNKEIWASKLGKLNIKIRKVEPKKTVPGGKNTFYNYDQQVPFFFFDQSW